MQKNKAFTKGKKGFLLSLDAIVAIGLLFLLATFLGATSLTHQNPEIEFKKIYYAGKDIHRVLAEARALDLDFPTISVLASQGAITDVNSTVLDMIGFYWSAQNLSIAQNITKEVIDAFFNSTTYGYEVLLDNTSIYKRGSPSRNLAKVTSVVSGIDLGKIVSGWVSSAWATRFRTNTTLILPFNPEGSGVEQGTVGTITKRFYLNSSRYPAIQNATLYLSIHFGNQDINSQDFQVNGNDIDGIITWLYSETKVINGKTTQLYFGQATIASFLMLDQWNEIEMELSGNQEWHSHIHPGFRLEMNLQENISSLFLSSRENTTIYFDNIQSEATGSKKSGTWSIQPFFIPVGATIREVFLRIRGEKLDNVSPSSIPASVPNKYNVQIYFNNLTVDLNNPNATGVFDKQYNLTGNVTYGTNIVSVYLNSYGDTFWGDGNTILLSDPETNASFSSNINIVYEKPPNELRYGKLKAGIRQSIGGTRSNPKNFTAAFNGSELFRTFLHLAQLDSGNVTVNVSYPGFAQSVFQTPRPLATPTTIFVDPLFLHPLVNNSINVSDACTTLCDILPESSFEYFIWLPSLVGYGMVFPNESTATADALQRLRSLLGNYAQATEIMNDTQGISNVPSLWGPARMEVRVWL